MIESSYIRGETEHARSTAVHLEFFDNDTGIVSWTVLAAGEFCTAPSRASYILRGDCKWIHQVRLKLLKLAKDE
jgi:hypothetical protein